MGERPSEERRRRAIGSAPLVWQLGGEHVDLLNDRRTREQLGRFLHQRRRYLTGQVGLASLVIRESVVDAEGARAEPHGIPGHGGRLALNERKRALKEGGHGVLLSGLRLEAD